MNNLMPRLSLLFFMVCSVAAAQTLSGLDSTFADNGVYTHSNELMYKVLIQPDGKIITIGWSMSPEEGLVVKRFFQNGTIDNSFNTANFFPAQTSTLSLLAACMQTDGKILFGGGGGMIRLQSNGSIDGSFGNAGYVLINSYSGITDLAIQADGKIIAVGVDVDSLANDCVLATRYYADGSIDSTFGNNGRILHRPGMYGSYTNKISLLPDGRIDIGLTAYINEIQSQAFAALRLLPDGEIDTSFNHTGLAWKQLPGLNYCVAMQLQPDGMILLAGYADSMALVRFDSDGAPDNTFGINGVAKVGEGELHAILSLQPDGKILIAPKDDSNFVISRIRSDGSPDMTFGVDGKIVTKVVQGTNVIHDIMIQADEKIIAVGGCDDYTEDVFKSVMVRYTADATNMESLPKHSGNVYVYPNPAGDYVNIQNNTAYDLKFLTC